MSFVYLRRLKDGGVIDVPKELVEETLKRGGFELVGDVILQATPEPVAEVKSFNCILCGFVGKNEQSLRMHRNKAHA